MGPSSTRTAGSAILQARVLRHVSPAFVEDPVRVLRLARFAARSRRWISGGFRNHGADAPHGRTRRG